MSMADAREEELRRLRWTRIALESWGTIGVLILVVAGLWLLDRLAGAVTPFVIGTIIVVLLRRPVAWLADRRVPRGLAVGLWYLAVAAVLTVAGLFILPPLYGQLVSFVTALPDYVTRAYQLWQAFAHPVRGAAPPSWLLQAVSAVKDTLVASAGRWSAGLATTAFFAGGQVVGAILSFVLSLLVGFYLLADLPKLREEALGLFREQTRGEVETVLGTVSKVLGGWMRGALIESTIVGTLYCLGFWLVGVPFPLVIGIIGGAINIVPYLGAGITASLAVVAALFVDPMLAVWALVVVLAVAQIDGLLIAPRVMSENVDLHPVVVIFSLLAGASLFGAPGMLLAVPVAAICKGLFVYYYEKRTRTQLGTDDGALFRTGKDDREDAGSGSTAGAGETTQT